MRTFLVFGVLATLLAAVSPASPAAAQDADEEARVHFRLGRAYHDSGRFEDAAREFETAYELSQRPQLLYNVFVAYRDAGRLGPAIGALERYLELVPDAQDRESLEARLASMRRLHGQQGGSDQQQESPAPTEPSSEPPPAEPSDERPIESSSSDATAEVVEVDETEPAARSQREDGGGGSLVPWIVMGGGGALLVGSVITGVMALSAESDLEQMCPMDACPAGFEDTRDRGQTLATVSDVLLVGGVLAAGAGAALLFLLDDSSSSERDPSVAAACTGDGCAASVHLRF